MGRLQPHTPRSTRLHPVRSILSVLLPAPESLSQSSGEFHQWRLPVPALWRDVLTKFRAAGLNAVSIYTHWGLIEPSRGQISFAGINALKPFFELCQELGLWVVVRPGPYINAETTAGGIAHWVTSEVPGRLRTNESEWFESWQAYVTAIIEETAPYQISEGGPVIGTLLLLRVRDEG